MWNWPQHALDIETDFYLYCFFEKQKVLRMTFYSLSAGLGGFLEVASMWLDLVLASHPL